MRTTPTVTCVSLRSALPLSAEVRSFAEEMLDGGESLPRLFGTLMGEILPSDESCLVDSPEVLIKAFLLALEGLRQVREAFNGSFSPVLNGRFVEVAFHNVPAELNQRIDSPIQRHYRPRLLRLPQLISPDEDASDAAISIA